jgi:hypothetical protein
VPSALTVAPSAARLRRIFRTLVVFHTASFTGLPLRFLVAFHGVGTPVSLSRRVIDARDSYRMYRSNISVTIGP